MWDLIVSVPDHCLSFYLELVVQSLMMMQFRFNLTKDTLILPVHSTLLPIVVSMISSSGRVSIKMNSVQSNVLKIPGPFI